MHLTSVAVAPCSHRAEFAAGGSPGAGAVTIARSEEPCEGFHSQFDKPNINLDELG